MHSFSSSTPTIKRLLGMRSLSDLSAKMAELQEEEAQQQQQQPLVLELQQQQSFTSEQQQQDTHHAVGSPPAICDTFLSSALGSVGEESLSLRNGDPYDDCPELNVESIHTFIGSDRHQTASGVPRPKILAQVSGTGLAPWEIHRPQKFVRDLVLRRCFSGRVLDAGCGIGDNALYVAKACPRAHVTAIDVVPRCLEFAAAKAGLRGMRGKVALEVGDLLEQDPDRQAPALGRPHDGCFSVILDSSTFHCFSDPERDCYVASLRRLLRPGGVIFMNCMSDEETRPGGPRRITVPDLLSVFNRHNGWEVETIEESVIDLHPTFWGGKAAARLFTIRKL